MTPLSACAAIDEWALSEACAQEAGWARPGRPITVILNADPGRFAGDGYLGLVEETRARTGLDPEQLVIEITERGIMSDRRTAPAMPSGLRTFGVRVALDEHVAEGVENAGQASVLRSLGCEFGQGFHFGSPRPAGSTNQGKP